MAPTKIMIIRHAEKPGEDNSKPFGVDASGQECGDSGKKHLTVRGWQRGGALVTLFAPPWGPRPGLATPDIMFASNPDHEEGENGTAHSASHRPYETLLPLATKLKSDGVIFDTKHHKDAYDHMIEVALTKTGAVLISWQHEDIPNLAQSILAHTNTPRDRPLNIPSHWPQINGEARYDLIWVFDFSPEDGTVQRFSEVGQQLLDGDAES